MTKVFIATGTPDYMILLLNKFAKEKLIYLLHPDHALLYHETEKKSVFRVPRKYEIVDAYRSFPKEGFAAFHYIPVVEEFCPVFEHRMKIRPKYLESAPGFLASRILRPLQSNTYLIITCWESKLYYESSKITDKIMESLGGDKSIEINPVKMFAGQSYIREYRIGLEEEDEK